jgi:hypothetical protein
MLTNLSMRKNLWPKTKHRDPREPARTNLFLFTQYLQSAVVHSQAVQHISAVELWAITSK